MTQVQIKNSIFIVTNLSFFLLEIFTCMLAQGIYFFPLLCYFSVLIPHEKSLTKLSLPLFLFALLSVFYFNIATLNFLYILPSFTLAKIAYNKLHVKKHLPFLLGNFNIICQYFMLSIVYKHTLCIDSLLAILLINNFFLFLCTIFTTKKRDL